MGILRTLSLFETTPSSQRKTSRRFRQLRLESLESRVVLDAEDWVVTGTTSITAYLSDDFDLLYGEVYEWYDQNLQLQKYLGFWHRLPNDPPTHGPVWHSYPTLASSITNITIYGLPGDDTIDLSRLTPECFTSLVGTYIDGDSGSDDIYGTFTKDEIRGAEGNDYIDGDEDEDKLYGGPDNDTIVGGDAWDTIEGNDGGDIIRGGPGDDEIRGNGGEDTIQGEAGADTIYGGTGNDVLYGGSSLDPIDGYSPYSITYPDPYDGNDHIDGNEDDDVIFGGQGADDLRGNNGNDTIYGGLGADLIYGGANNDYIYGNIDNDILYGDAGDDWIEGGAGNDQINGGNDKDILWSGQSMTIDQPWNGNGGTSGWHDMKGTGPSTDGACDVEDNHPECSGGPVAVDDDMYSVSHNASITSMNISAPGVLGNDQPIFMDMSPMSMTLVGTGPAHADVFWNTDSTGAFFYNPNNSFVGIDVFFYRTVQSGEQSHRLGVVTINVTNDAPNADDDVASTMTNMPVTWNVLMNDSDMDNDDLDIARIITQPTHGSREIACRVAMV